MSNPAIREFINNEATFINSMNVFVQKYIRPILQSETISKNDRIVLSNYANTVTALGFSYANLDLAASKSDEEFLDKLNSELFEEHANNIIPLCLQVQELQNIYDRQNGPPAYPTLTEQNVQPFSSYPILAVQRTTRYKMTLQEALKKEEKSSPKDSEKIAKINQAIEATDNINKKLNSQQARNDGRNKALQDCRDYVDVKKKQSSKNKWGLRLILTQPTPINASQTTERDEYIKTILTTVFHEHFVIRNGDTYFIEHGVIQRSPLDLTNIESFAQLMNVDADLYNILIASAPIGSCDTQTQLNAITYSLDLLTSNRLGKRTQSPVAKELLSKVENIDPNSPEANRISQTETRITDREGRPFSARAFSAIRNFKGTTFGSPSSRSSNSLSTKSLSSESSDTSEEPDSENESPNKRNNSK